jgi:phospholipase C
MTVVRLLLVLLSLHIVFAASPFKNVIILMMENHSFDNIFGFTPGIGNLTGKEYNREKPSSWLSKKYFAGRGSKYCTIPDPGHSFTATGRQLYLPDKAPAVGVGKPTNGGFVADFTGAGKKGHDLQEVMNVYLPEQLPIITTLAREFVVCRNWYASLPGPTGPNRMFAHTATTYALHSNTYTFQ